MRRFFAIVRATTLEILNEPLSLLVLTASLALALFSSEFHYHQFGEASRMARDAGLSAVMFGGAVFAVFGATRGLRREIESGTATAALAHSVGRQEFFFAKIIGAVAALSVFALIAFPTVMALVNAAEIGGRIAETNGDIARLYGPSFALALATVLAPYIIAAALNRFCAVRFVWGAFMLSLPFALVSVCFHIDLALFARLLPALVLALMPALVLLAAASAFASRLKANVALSATAIIAALASPAIGNYFLSNALAKGGSVSVGYFGIAFVAALAAAAAFALAGAMAFDGRDVG